MERKKLEFRLLTASEIDCRMQSSTTNYAIFLLYKDARVDMNLLDEVVGSMNWQRTHSRDNANCIVSIWDEEKKQWISKEDTGTESNADKEKGLASDSFKRACFNWGIGRELYSSPKIYVKPLQGEDISKLRLKVAEIGYNDNREINRLVLVDVKTGNVRFTFGTKSTQANVSNATNITDDVAIIIEDIKRAKTLDELTNYYNQYVDLKNNQAFMAALTLRKQQLYNELQSQSKK